MRRLPVWLRVLTGSASAMSSSIFFRGAVARPVVAETGVEAGSVPVVEAARVGGRRTMACMAGSVRVPACPSSGFAGTGVGTTWGPAATGTGLIVGGWGSAGEGFGLTVAGATGGRGGLDSAWRFLDGKKMSGQGIVMRSCAQFQGMEMNLNQAARFFRRNTI